MKRPRTAKSVRNSAANIMRFCQNWLDGVDSNIRHKRQAAARAQVDVVRVALNDLPDLVETALSISTPKTKNAEIQRLRAAMVYALADCEEALSAPGQMAKPHQVLVRRAMRILREALETE